LAVLIFNAKVQGVLARFLTANFDFMDESARHQVADSTLSTARRDNAAISSIKSKLYSVVLPEPLS
jgi:hypothetical protein